MLARGTAVQVTWMVSARAGQDEVGADGAPVDWAWAAVPTTTVRVLIVRGGQSLPEQRQLVQASVVATVAVPAPPVATTPVSDGIEKYVFSQAAGSG